MARTSSVGNFSFDVYLSFSPQEKNWAIEWLLPRLEEAGLRVFVDFRDARPGASKITEIERAVLESSKTILILTPYYLTSEWNDFQSILIQYLDPAARQQRLIPLIYKEMELPLRLNMLVPVDFTDPSQRETQLERLLGAFGVKIVPTPVERDQTEDLKSRTGAHSDANSPTIREYINEGAVADEIRDIRNYLQKERLVLFIGSDLPEGLSGAPDRQTLANRLAAEKGLAQRDPHEGRSGGWHLASVAQQVMTHGNRFEYTQFLKTQLANLRPGSFYTALARFIQAHLPRGTVITTAYHRMLEMALEEAGEYRLQTVTQDSMLPFIEADAPVLYKIFGDIQQADLVVTEQDQNAFLRGRVQERQDIFDEVSRLIKRNSLLLLGVDPRDAVVFSLLDEVAGGRFQIPSFFVWPGLGETETLSLESNRGLKILNADPVSLLRLLHA